LFCRRTTRPESEKRRREKRTRAPTREGTTSSTKEKKKKEEKNGPARKMPSATKEAVGLSFLAGFSPKGKKKKRGGEERPTYF